MVFLRDPVIIKNGETSRVLPLSTLSPGTYTIPVQPNGNSLLASLLVLALDPGASITVRFYQTTSADESQERSELVAYEPVTTASPQASRILVTGIHSKVFVEIEIAGGDVNCGILGTVVSSFASDLEAALKRDGQLANLALDKGLPIVVLNTTTGRYEVWEGEDGIPAVRLLGDVQVNLAALKDPVVSNVNMPDGSTEVTFPVPAGTRAYAVKSRSGAPFRLAFLAGGTNTVYLTTGAHEAANLDTSSSITLYARSQRTSGDVLEILSWS